MCVRGKTVPSAILLPPLFVQCDLRLYRRKILAGQITEIALIAADTERRHSEPCLKRRHAERLVVRTRRHMGAHNGHRIAVRNNQSGSLPGRAHPCHRTPRSVENRTKFEIEPVAARRASLKENVRETRGKFSHAAVQSQHIAVCHLSLPLRRKRSGIVIRKRPVHIPFDIGDLRRGKYLCHRLNNIVLHFCSRKIQNALIASLRVRFFPESRSSSPDVPGRDDCSHSPSPAPPRYRNPARAP